MVRGPSVDTFGLTTCRKPKVKHSASSLISPEQVSQDLESNHEQSDGAIHTSVHQVIYFRFSSGVDKPGQFFTKGKQAR